MRVAFVSCVTTKSATPELAEHRYMPFVQSGRQDGGRQVDLL